MSDQDQEGLWINNLILGTAGHIDHGKSSLVQKLTGIDPDRLPEEKERKLTIDLGFAPWTLPDGRTVGIIDVPGHERFIKNMVAGATGIDVVLLVVAADDGIMPQTREHFEILKLLDLNKGLIALTKIDLVDEELVQVVELELEEFVAGSFLEGAPIMPVSAITGQGIDALKEVIIKSFDSTDHKLDDGPFRMPVQRVFSARGHGTVLTGVPLSGQVQVGDELELLPSGKKAKVRGLQAYKKSVTKARAGHSTAVNVPDIDWNSARRGQVLCSPGLFQSSQMIEVRFDYLQSAGLTLKNRSRIRFHSGTSEVLGEIVIIDKAVLNPGDSALCQLRLDEPVVNTIGDRFILRLHSPLILLGGGQVLGLSEYRLKSGKDFVINRLQQKVGSLDSIKQQVLLKLEEQDRAFNAKDLSKTVNQTPEQTLTLLEELSAEGQALSFEAKGKKHKFIAIRSLARLERKAIDQLAEYHARNPKRPSMPQTSLGQKLKLDPLLTGLLLQRAESIVEVGERSFKLKDFEVRLNDAEKTVAEDFQRVLNDSRFAPPRRPDLLDDVAGRNPRLKRPVIEEILDWLIDSGQLVALSQSMIFSKAAYQDAQQAVRVLISKHGPLTAAAFKEHLNVSRKFAVPLLESFDALGLTQREGNTRTLVEVPKA